MLSRRGGCSGRSKAVCHKNLARPLFSLSYGFSSTVSFGSMCGIEVDGVLDLAEQIDI
jgi:hypothetical protein